MAELGSLEISVDTSSVVTATANLGKLSQVIGQMATNLARFSGVLNGIAGSLTTIGNAGGAAATKLAPFADSLRQINNATRAASTQKLTRMANSLQQFADSARDASKEAAGLKLPSVFSPGGGGGMPGGGAAGGMGDLFRARAGIAMTGTGGINPFAAGMLNLPPQAAAAMAAIAGVVGVVKTATDGLLALGSAAIETGLRFERLRAMLTVAGGGMAGASNEFRYITDLSMKMGLNLEQATEGYAKFKVAANGAGMEASKTRQIFESISKATVAMGLSTSDQSRVFLALEQMLSKGKVSAEELRRQLGNALPGAFTLMAKAAKTAGVSVTGSTGELEKLMKAGKLISAEVLPAFAVEVEKAFGAGFTANSDNLRSNINRMETAWGLFLKAVSDLGLMDAANTAVKGFGYSIQQLVDWVKELSTTTEGQLLVQSIKDLGSAAASAAGDLTRLITGVDKSAIESLAGMFKFLADSVRGAMDFFKGFADGAMIAMSTLNPFLLASERFRNAWASQYGSFIEWFFGKPTTSPGQQAAEEMAKAERAAAKLRAKTATSSNTYWEAGGKYQWAGGATVEVNASTGSSALAGEEKLSSAQRKRLSFMESATQKILELETRLHEQGSQGELDRFLLKKAGFVENTRGYAEALAALQRQHALEGEILAVQERSRQSKSAARILDRENSAWMQGFLRDQERGLRAVANVDPTQKFITTKGILYDIRVDAEAGNTALLNMWRSGTISADEYYARLIKVNKESQTLGDVIGPKIASVFSDILSSMVDLAVEGKGSFRELIADMIKQIAKLIFWYGVLVPLVRSAFGGAGGAGGWGDMVVQAVSKRGTGGSVTSSTPYMVGERGPEMFVPGRSGTIIPNKALGGGSSGPVTVMVNVSTSGTSAKVQQGQGEDDARDARNLGNRIGEAVRGIIMDELRPGGLIKEGVR